MQRIFSFDVVTEFDQLTEIVQLQKLVWGEEVITSLPQMVAANHNGGVVIGAFDAETQKLIGFCYGFTGFSSLSDAPYLCSHMMAIHPDYHNQGIGEMLKFKQRDWAIHYGYKKMVWTFDPLEIRNGYLNLCKLGGYVKTYIKDYYGFMNDKLNKGVPSDRFLVEWDLFSNNVINASVRIRNYSDKWENYELLEDDFDDVYLESQAAKHHSGYLVPVPPNIQQMKMDSPDLVKEWRMKLRKQFSLALSSGYFVAGMIRGDRVGYYVLEKYSV
ncbi:GNAT family N-acetyltransferase [Fictibacillus barbaricus]|uniref:GNAT family N-acetyltransferase n=1 Tax=Fictibacillus barbaricus TaxID=182136 RepID=A0ABS2ZA50_9BACL|nr:GNAT family N-acetyltransferase [Fictibacillus barbaricus]MBN3544198.1 GNAT family N-acetyltransferase [Fictibacillus barbaricus]GGB69724.1 hypothetical protein GCM10007199_39950 [Fictibacillus barbaricus]